MNEKRLLILTSILVVALIGMIGYQGYHLQQLNHRIETLQVASGPIDPPTSIPSQSSQPSVTVNPQPGGAVDPFQSLWDDPVFGSDDWNPFEEIQRMQQHMDRMFSSTLNRLHASPSFGPVAADSFYLPELDLREEEDNYMVTFDLPGIEDSRIDIRVDGRRLSISGERNETIEQEDDSGRIIREERRLGKFERSLTLPGPIDREAVVTNYEDGVLTIALPKAGEEEPRKIPLDSGKDQPAS